MKKIMVPASIFLVAMSSCGKHPGATSSAANITTKLKTSSGAALTNALRAQVRDLVGQNNLQSIYSMKYYITNIAICQKMEIDGSGYKNATGCIPLYSGSNPAAFMEGDDTSLDFLPMAAAARASDDGFIDLMDPISRAKLSTNTSITEDQVGSYQYGTINWALPIKIRADIPITGGGTFRTADGPTVSRNSGRNYTYKTTYPGDFSTNLKATETIVMLPNGGTFFKFQKPLVISKDDVVGKSQFQLDLAFNPDGLLKGYSSPGNGSDPNVSLTDSVHNGIEVPFIDLGPIPHRSDDQVIKESYSAQVDSGLDHFNVRIELYYLKSDPSKSIYAVEAKTLINGQTTQQVPSFPRVVSVLTAKDGSLEFDTWSSMGVVTGFARGNKVGDSVSALINCGNPALGGFYTTSCTSSISANFNLDQIVTLQ